MPPPAVLGFDFGWGLGVPRRVRIQGTQTFVLLNSRLESYNEEERVRVRGPVESTAPAAPAGPSALLSLPEEVNPLPQIPSSKPWLRERGGTCSLAEVRGGGRAVCQRWGVGVGMFLRCRANTPPRHM